MAPDWTTYLLQTLPLAAALAGLVGCTAMGWRRRHAGYLLGTLGFTIVAAGIGVTLYSARLPMIWRDAAVSDSEIGWRMAGYAVLTMFLTAGGYLTLLAALAVAGSHRLAPARLHTGATPPRRVEPPEAEQPVEAEQPPGDGRLPGSW